MYESLIMLKRNTTFFLDDLEIMVREVAASSAGTIERRNTSIILKSADAFLQIDFNNAPHVIEESKEIAKNCNIACAECVSRFEMYGDDLEMELFNDYLLINERLNDTGKFFIFDQIEGKLFGT